VKVNKTIGFLISYIYSPERKTPTHTQKLTIKENLLIKLLVKIDWVTLNKKTLIDAELK